MFKQPQDSSVQSELKRHRAMRDMKSEGSLPQRIEALSRSRAPDPPGKGIAMLVLGAAVLAALIYQFSQMGTRREGDPVRGDATQAPVVPGDGSAASELHLPGTSPRKPAKLTATPNASSARVELTPNDIATASIPEGVPDELAPQMALAMAQARRGNARITRKGLMRLARLVWEVPEAVRRAVRERALRSALESAKRAEMRGIALEAATWLREGASESEQSLLTRFVPHAQLALDEPAQTDGAIAFLFSDKSDTTRTLLAEVIASNDRSLVQRIAAARAYAGRAPTEAMKKLIDDPATPEALRTALDSSR